MKLHRMSCVLAMQYFRPIGLAIAERRGKSASVPQQARRQWGACCGSMACRSACLRPYVQSWAWKLAGVLSSAPPMSFCLVASTSLHPTACHAFT